MKEQEYENEDGSKLQEVLADGLKEKLYGKVVRRIYPSEANGMFERFEASKATVDDLKNLMLHATSSSGTWRRRTYCARV